MLRVDIAILHLTSAPTQSYKVMWSKSACQPHNPAKCNNQVLVIYGVSITSELKAGMKTGGWKLH